MSDSQVFYRKWRPQTLAEVVGQEHVTQTLYNALQSGRVAHAYLFCGPRGTGKTSSGRILAKAVNCLNNGRGEPCNACSMCQAITEGRALDVIEIDAASNRGIDEVRELRERVNFAPNVARYKVYIIDEVHMLTEPASNALLKTLEEPPTHAMFVLATTEPHKMLPTILSRCQRFDFRRIPQAAVVSRLEHICEKEGIHIESTALRLIARSATGSLRDAENILEQLLAYYGSEIALSQVKDMLGLGSELRVKELAKHLVNKDIPSGLRTINQVLEDGLDLGQFNRELVCYLREVLLVASQAEGTLELTPEELEERRELASKASAVEILTALKLFGQISSRFDDYSPLPLELALVECGMPAEVVTPTHTEAAIATSVEVTTGEPFETQVPDESPEEQDAIATSAEEKPLTKSLEGLKANWKKMLDEAPPNRKRTVAIALLRSSCVPVAMEGDTVVLEFSHDIHKERMEKLENQSVAEEVLGNFLGHSTHIRCTLKPRKPKKQATHGHLVKTALEMGASIIGMEEINNEE